MIFNRSKYNDHWSTVQLSQLGEFKRGKSKHRPRNDVKLFENGIYPLVQTGEIKSANLYINNHSATYNEFGLQQSKLWGKNTLCITIAANIAETAILAYPMCFPDSIVGFNSFEGKSTEVFVHYVFTYIKRAIQNAASGSIQDNINIDFLTKLNFKIPDFDNQKAIAKVLSDLDAKIELNNKINAELEAMTKLIYDYWFIQFDFPYDFAQGKPDKNGKPYKSSGGKMVFNEELNREIPEGWEVDNILRIGELLGGGTPKTKEPSFWNGTIPFFTPADYSGSTFSLMTKQNITTQGLESCSSKLHSKGTIFITARGSVGKINIASKKMAMNQSCYAIKAKPMVNYYYLHQSVIDFVHYLKAKSNGSIFDAIVSNDIKLTPIVIAPIELITDYGNLVGAQYEQMLTNDEQNQKLSELRDWLLPMLMNGQVTVNKKEETSVYKQLKITPFTAQQAKVRRKMLATYIINQSLKDNAFGKTKFEKLLHLVEYHIIKTDYNQTYSVQAAGPYDGRFTKSFWNEVTKSKWFAFQEEGRRKRIVAAEKHEKSVKDYGYFTQKEKQRIQDLITLFKTDNFERPEIISTLYAVWNNRILRKEKITDELLKKDFLAWDKQKIRYKNRLDGALKWMREQEITPDGWGKLISRAKNK